MEHTHTLTHRHVISLFVSHPSHTKQCEPFRAEWNCVCECDVRRKKCQQFVYSQSETLHRIAYSWLDAKQTKPTKLKVNEAKTNWHTTLHLTTETNSHNHKVRNGEKQRHKKTPGKMIKEITHIRKYGRRSIGQNWKVTLSFMALFKPLSNILLLLRCHIYFFASSSFDGITFRNAYGMECVSMC